MECQIIRKMKKSRITNIFLLCLSNIGDKKINDWKQVSQEGNKVLLTRWGLWSLEVPNGLCLLASVCITDFPHDWDKVPDKAT